MSELLKRQEAAQALNVSVFVFDEIVKKGELQPIEIGKRHMYLKSDIQKYIEGKRKSDNR